MLLNLVKKTKQTYVLVILTKCVFTLANYDLWVSKMAHDVFALIVNFLKENWMLKHITIKLFETFETVGQTLIRSLQNLLKYNLSSITTLVPRKLIHLQDLSFYC